MNLAGLAFLMALQVGQIRSDGYSYSEIKNGPWPCDIEVRTPDNQAGICWYNVPLRTRHADWNDLMPLVEPLPPNECERRDGDFVEVLCFREWDPPFANMKLGPAIVIDGAQAKRPPPSLQKKMKSKLPIFDFPTGYMCCVGCDNLPICPESMTREGDEIRARAAGKPSVVPAIQHKNCNVVRCDKGENCEWKRDSCSYWTCADKRYTLLVAENGDHNCVFFRADNPSH